LTIENGVFNQGLRFCLRPQQPRRKKKERDHPHRVDAASGS